VALSGLTEAPIAFLDFETVNPAIPVWPGCPPDQLDPAQFSCHSGGKALFTRTYTADDLEGSFLALNTGVFASVDTLRARAERTLDQLVDKALDDSALRNVMQP
jgi:hypothetical protein